jgi:hypothetical protein
MLKRNRQMKINKGMLLFNGAGVLVGLGIAGGLISSLFTTEEIPACTDRYASAMQLALDNSDGAVLSPIELQSRAGAGEWGVLENASIVRVAGAPTRSVMEVRLAEAPNSAPAGTKVAGMGMSWIPRALENAGSGCLTYSVYLPETFEFASGGTLPGVYGGMRPDTTGATSPAAAEPGYLARLHWSADGGLSLWLRFSGKDAPASVEFQIDRFTMPRGRWVSVQQEVVMNKPDAADGMVRLWVDGKLRLDRGGVVWRKDPATAISGVLVDVTSPPPGSKPMALRLSAPVFGWKAG